MQTPKLSEMEKVTGGFSLFETKVGKPIVDVCFEP